MALQGLIGAVKLLKSDKDMHELVTAYSLQAEDRTGSPLDQIMGVYIGRVEGQAVKLTHTWYDRCKTFEIRPDGNDIELTVDGKQAASGKYLDER